MRAVRAVLTGVLGLAMLACSAIGVDAQEEDLSHRIPPDTAPGLVVVTGTTECGVAASGPAKRGIDWSRLRGWTLSCQAEMSDPRLTGELRGTSFGQDCTDDACVSWSTMSMGHGDAWEGWMVGTSSQGEEVSLAVLTGGVENEGLTAVITAVGPHGQPQRATGYIHEGDPPPVP